MPFRRFRIERAVLVILLFCVVALSCDRWRGRGATALGPDGPTSPLHRAAAVGDKDKVLRWLESGAAIDGKDRHEWTPLHWAAIANQPDMAGVLLDRGADPNARGQFDLTPLHWAALKGRTEIVKLLLTRGARPDARSLYGRTPLHEAADPPVARALLAAGATLEARDDHGMTPLHTARQGLVASALIQAGADPRLETYDGRSALYLAVVESLEPQGIGIQAAARPMRLQGTQGHGSVTLRSVTEKAFEDLRITATSAGCEVAVTPSPIARFEPGQMTELELAFTRRPGVAEGVYLIEFTASAAGREIGKFGLKVDTTPGETAEDRGMIQILGANVRPAPSRSSYLIFLVVPVLIGGGWWALRLSRGRARAGSGTSRTGRPE